MLCNVLTECSSVKEAPTETHQGTTASQTSGQTTGAGTEAWARGAGEA